MRFVKMHGAGNDYIYVDCFLQERPKRPERLARELSDRRFGVGSDGLILLLPSERADLKMEIYNSDGSRAEICGNGLRCAALYARERRAAGEKVSIETDAGVRTAFFTPEGVRVNMGRPSFAVRDVPMLAAGETFIAQELPLASGGVRATALSVGNPHCVVFGRLGEFERLAPEIQASPLFPAGVNVEFAELLPDGSMEARVLERGSGETYACGTGASAVLAAAAVEGRSPREALIRLRGGPVFVEWKDEIHMTGGAEIIFDGDIDISKYEGA